MLDGIPFQGTAFQLVSFDGARIEGFASVDEELVKLWLQVWP